MAILEGIAIGFSLVLLAVYLLDMKVSRDDARREAENVRKKWTEEA